MKIFATILLASVALTLADVSSLAQNGYNNAQHQSLISHILSGPLNQQASQAQFQVTNQPSQQYLPQHAQSSLPASYPMPVGFPGAQVNVPASLQNTRRYRPRTKIPKKPIVTKNFFIHSAPEESEDEIQEELSQMQQPHKHYNVLFVKAPTQSSKVAAKNLAKSLKEEKTVVYVLSKKTTAADLQDAIAEEPQHINRPEVFFIKYRTPEEAAHAQRQIQTQYDSLGGSSTITDEGISPITSVVGSLDEPEEEEINEQQQSPQFDEQLANSINNIANGAGFSDINSNNVGASDQYLPPNRY